MVGSPRRPRQVAQRAKADRCHFLTAAQAAALLDASPHWPPAAHEIVITITFFSPLASPRTPGVPRVDGRYVDSIALRQKPRPSMEWRGTPASARAGTTPLPATSPGAAGAPDLVCLHERTDASDQQYRRHTRCEDERSPICGRVDGEGDACHRDHCRVVCDGFAGRYEPIGESHWARLATRCRPRPEVHVRQRMSARPAP